MVNVLLVEDDLLSQKITRRFLVDCGMNVTIANDGAEALSLIREKHFSLILMDLQMPTMDGCEAARRIRALSDPHFKTVPILAFTSSLELREKATAFGMNDFLNKPLNSEELRAKINQYLA